MGDSDLNAKYARLLNQMAEIYADDGSVAAQLHALSITAEQWDENKAGGHLQFAVPPDVPAMRDDTIEALASGPNQADIEIIFHAVGVRLNWGEWFNYMSEPIRLWPPEQIRPLRRPPES